MQKKRRTLMKGCPGIYRSISGSYEIAYRDSDGRQVFKTMPKPVKGDARGALEAAKLERANAIARLGRGEKERRAPERFGAYAHSIIAGLDRAPRTIEKHEYHLRVHLKRFEKTRLSDIDVDKVAALVAHMKRRKYAGATIAGTLSTLSLVMTKAQRPGYAQANPVTLLDEDERPTIQTSTKRALDEAEITKLLTEAGDTFRPVISFMLFTGVRIGEALGMRWQDVDFDAQFVHVRSQLGRDRKLADVKTDAGKRSIVFVPQLARVMKEHKLRSPYSRPTDYVFANPDGRARDHRSTSKGIERAVDRAKLGDGISAHSFRHTFASMLIVGLRYDAVAVSKQLGHTKPSFTQDTYAHMFDRAKHAAQLRGELDRGFGHLLGDVNTMSNSGGNQPQSEPSTEAPIAVSVG